MKIHPPASRPCAAAILLVAMAAAPLAQAHPGHGGTGLVAGLVHPLTGWDHLAALLAVGLWVASLAGAARWIIPSAFLGAMALGAAWGHTIGPVAGTEQAIAASVLVAGLLSAGAIRLPLAAGAGLTTLFAIFHGLAHGAELPTSASGLAFGAGFLSASAVLLAAGFLAGSQARRLSPNLPRLAGWAVAAFALMLFARF